MVLTATNHFQLIDHPSLMGGETLYKKQMMDIHNRIVIGNYPIIEFDEQHINYTTQLKWVQKGEVIAGSYLCSLINGNIKARDIDIYFHSKEDTREFCKLNNINIDNYINNAKFCCHASSYGHTLNLIWGINYDSAKDLIARFDIRACAIAFDPMSGKTISVIGAIVDCAQKHIVFQTNPRTVSVARLLKYVEKGFTIDAYQRAVFAELIKAGNHDTELELITGYRR